ncbi:DUF4367 domain-containing protein [Brevibacillus composti]|uniref:DUF4367 domain-containing protein n=1 Tax=Brevibacillus composti TaxID=2796470 RepID=A0A7T5EJ54_9BACL|nr:DUF4367 domain-containing protein [Brevibacillus composti]QUO40663.1 DUF4367 domain-containing protein [Brevibacillus composti]
MSPNNKHQWDIRYTSTTDDSFIHLSITQGDNGIMGNSEKFEINGNKAEFQENEKFITLSWKHKGVSYFLIARTSDKLSKDK